jgi:hypothetical protein
MAMAASTAWGLAAVAIAPYDQSLAGLLSSEVDVAGVQPVNTILNNRATTARILKVIWSFSSQFIGLFLSFASLIDHGII